MITLFKRYLTHNDRMPRCSMLRCAIFSLALLFTVQIAFCADHYVRAGASGNGSGSDWNNACPDFVGACAPSSLVRGDTYYVAAGTYAGRTFNKPTSGSITITIKRATLSDHGTATGWQNSFDGHAEWTSTVDFSTGYWVFDGVTSPATPLSSGAGDPTQYGFAVWNSSACSSNDNTAVLTVGHNTFRHVATRNHCGAAYDPASQFGFMPGDHTSGCTNLTFSHTYAENDITDFQQYSEGSCDNVVIEYHYSKGQWTTPSAHGEVVAMSGSNYDIRWNYFDQCTGTGCIASNGGGMDDWRIYGNVMNNVTNGGTGCSNGGNGAIAGAGAYGVYTNAQIYNNTIIQPGMCYGWFYDNAGSNNVAYNNVIKGNCLWNGHGTHDYNYYLSCNPGQGAPAEENGQTSSTSPFINLSTKNFHLATDTHPWKTLASPYNRDIDGVIRTSSRGAYQIIQTILPPQDLTVSIQ